MLLFHPCPIYILHTAVGRRLLGATTCPPGYSSVVLGVDTACDDLLTDYSMSEEEFALANGVASDGDGSYREGAKHCITLSIP